MSQSDQLPDLWTYTKIGDVAAVNPPGSTVTAYDEQLVTFLPMAAVAELTGRVDMSMQRPFGEVKKGFTRFRDGDVLFAKITPCMENGKSAVVRGLAGGIGCGSTEFHVMRPAEGISPDYLRYFVSRSVFRQEAKRNMQGAVGQQRVPVDFIREADLPLAPAAEQERIVSKIEELFSRIDEGERALERVQTLVERYRQSVLKAAVTGELTRAWREQRKGKLESGEALLARILKARRAAWEKAELDKMKAKGIKFAGDAWKRKYKEPSPPSTTDLQELPEGWVWVSVEQLCFVDTGATPKRGTEKYFKNGTVDWITSSAVNEPIILNAEERITEVAIQETNAKVFPVGSLIVAMYGEGKTRGKISELGIPAATNQACAALICGHLAAEVKFYLKRFFEKNYSALRSEAAGGVQPNLNLAIIKGTVLPLPPLKELVEINDAVELRASQAASFASEFSSWDRQSTALRQKILGHAFSGLLVHQDPADEPAEALLRRIAIERQSQSVARSSRGRKPASARKPGRKPK
jgi:type I restriction enzyme S subunit